jgi:hypothetical protein
MRLALPALSENILTILGPRRIPVNRATPTLGRRKLEAARRQIASATPATLALTAHHARHAQWDPTRLRWEAHRATCALPANTSHPRARLLCLTAWRALPTQTRPRAAPTLPSAPATPGTREATAGRARPVSRGRTSRRLARSRARSVGRRPGRLLWGLWTRARARPANPTATLRRALARRASAPATSATLGRTEELARRARLAPTRGRRDRPPAARALRAPTLPRQGHLSARRARATATRRAGARPRLRASVSMATA